MQDLPPFQSLSVIGGGAWGTALANLAASKGLDALLWAREPETADAINTRHENTLYLKGVPLADALRATSDIAEAARRDAFIFAAPAQFARRLFDELQKLAPSDAAILLCSKGLERQTGLFMTEVIAEVWPHARPSVLSGPCFARDVAQGKPTAATLASSEPELGERWAATVKAAHFRPYLGDDLLGAELGGAMKNVIAIAAGVVEGKELGDSARAALIARGFAEFQRLGVALGAKPQTMAGLSGLGDLILTCGSRQSRNMSLGYEMARGQKLEEILGARSAVTEGVATAAAVVRLCKKCGVEAPICEAVADLVDGRTTVDEAIADLMARPLRDREI